MKSYMALITLSAIPISVSQSRFRVILKTYTEWRGWITTGFIHSIGITVSQSRHWFVWRAILIIARARYCWIRTDESVQRSIISYGNWTRRHTAWECLMLRKLQDRAEVNQSGIDHWSMRKAFPLFTRPFLVHWVRLTHFQSRATDAMCSR